MRILWWAKIDQLQNENDALRRKVESKSADLTVLAQRIIERDEIIDRLKKKLDEQHDTTRERAIEKGSERKT